MLPPKRGVRGFLRPLGYPWNWEAYVYESTTEKETSKRVSDQVARLDRNDGVTQEISKILQLQNFKFELKNYSSHSEVVDLLAKFEFIQALLGEGGAAAADQSSSAAATTVTLERDPLAFIARKFQDRRKAFVNSEFYQFVHESTAH